MVPPTVEGMTQYATLTDVKVECSQVKGVQQVPESGSGRFHQLDRLDVAAGNQVLGHVKPELATAPPRCKVGALPARVFKSSDNNNMTARS